ncbi:MAG: penicillin-binding protein 2 [Nitrospirae bacterium]|nr:penicillin-binding protein 2 [Nitrospirota bacterium]
MRDKKKTLYFFVYITLGVMCVFILRLWQLQILKGDYYREKSIKNRVRIIRLPAPRGIIYDRKGNALVKNTPYFIVSLIPELSEEVDVKGLSQLLGVSEEEIQERINKHDKHSLEPIRLKEGITFKEVSYIEARRSDFPGLIVETDITRTYPYKETAAHLIGYLSHPAGNRADMETKGFSRGTFIGQWGVEHLYDDKLRGQPGKKYIEVDALGRQLRTLKVLKPVKGEDIRLSIDLDTQIAAERAFKRRSGALLALDPNSGDILAMVSLPSFDPNIFIKGVTEKQWKRLLRNPGHPLLNRVFQSQYPPGSVFKIITAIAALQEGIITKNFKVNCTGEIQVGNWRFRCWKKGGHGIVNLRRAIVESCDVYFYEVGRMLGIDRIAKYAHAFGLGKPTGIRLVSEKRGLIPTTKWKLEKKGRPWYLGETFNASIGQGYVTVTPAQAAVLISALANGGKVFRPKLTLSEAPEIISRLPLKKEIIKFMNNALTGVIEDPKGTGWRARSDKVRIAGKTGTAQVISISDNMETARRYPKDHAWFVAFAPVEKPSIALSVFVEHGGHGGKSAAPIARTVIETYLRGNTNEDKGTEVIN